MLFLRTARTVCPEGTFVFVWVNSHHNIRFFDNRPETDGSLRRGSYVQAGKSKIYLSTTGYNPFRARWALRNRWKSQHGHFGRKGCPGAILISGCWPFRS